MILRIKGGALSVMAIAVRNRIDVQILESLGEGKL